MEAAIDKFGRVVIPKRFRDHYDLRAGSHILVEEEKGVIVLKPIKNESPLVLKKGVLVHTGKATVNLDKFVLEHRRQRIQTIMSSFDESSV